MLQLKFLLSFLLFFSLKVEASQLNKQRNFEDELEVLQAQSSDDLSWFSRSLISFFSPEGLKALERIDRRARLSEPKIYEIEMELREFDDPTKFYSKLNSIAVVSDSEDSDSDDEEYGYISPNMAKLRVIINNGLASFTRYFDYQEILFKAAISQSNFDRLNQLFATKLDKKFTNEQKIQVLSDAINIAVNNEFIKDNTLPLSIISLLLKHNFADISDDYLLDCPLQNVFKNEKVARTFLEHNSQFFSNLKTFNYVANEIFNRDFHAARVALESGVDPEISYFGRNALDVALSITDYEPNSDLLFLTNFKPFSGKKENPLSYLIRTLKEMGVTESMTFDNFFHSCNEKQIILAQKILQTGSIIPQEFYFPGNQLISPVSKAIHSEDVNLIKQVAVIFLSHLTTSQLQHARSECFSLLRRNKLIEDSSINELLDEIDYLILSK